MNKKIIAGTLAGLLGLGAYLQLGRPSIESVVKREFDSFPTEIPGAKSVKKYETEGAKYCLVHIKQFHVNPGIQTEARIMAMKAQADIYTIVSQLSKNQGLKTVYVEGETPYSVAKFKELKDNYELVKQRMGAGKINTLIGERAWMRLYLNNIAEPMGGETLAGNERALEIVKDHTKFSDEELGKSVFDDREDALLKIIGENQPGVFYTIFGSGHRWKDNIDRWNKTHQDKKFSLIEVAALAEERDKAFWGENTNPLYLRLKIISEEQNE